MPRPSSRKKKPDILSHLFDLADATIAAVVLGEQPLEVEPANRSRYTTISASRRASVGMGYLKAIGAVLCGLVERFESNAAGTVGRARLLSSTGSGAVYPMSWDMRSPQALRFGGFSGGLPSYQVAVLQFIACFMDPYNKRPMHWSEEVAERWTDVLTALEAVYRVAYNAPYWDTPQLGDLCSQLPGGQVEALADALYFSLRYQLPQTGDTAKREILCFEDDVVPAGELLARGGGGALLLAGHGTAAPGAAARAQVASVKPTQVAAVPTALVRCHVCQFETPTSDPFCANCGAYIDPNSLAPGQARPAASIGGPTAFVAFQTHFTGMQLVAKGGMGRFHKAYDPVLDRWVGAKALILDQLSPQQILEAGEAFKQEARFMACLHHPTIPSVYGFGEIDGQLCLLMEYIQGETLEDYLQHKGIPVDPGNQAGLRCLPLREVLEIASTLCDFLSFLHAPLATKGTIIYRDLKPSNVLITPDRFLYVVDFGIARSFKPGKQKDTAALGSWGYSPPEQFGKRQTDERSDLYSLGAVTHQLLSGLDPSDSPFVFDPFSTLALPTQPPPDLERLVLSMVESDMKKRPASATLVRQEVQSIQRQLGYI